MIQPLITVEELAQFIRKSVASVYSDLHRNPASLPPIIRLPGSRRVLFDRSAVEAWIASHTTTTLKASTDSDSRMLPGNPPLVQKGASRPRGRPTKASVVAKRTSGGIK